MLNFVVSWFLRDEGIRSFETQLSLSISRPGLRTRGAFAAVKVPAGVIYFAALPCSAIPKVS